LKKDGTKRRGAPGYIVSMGSLWTIMLTFFILMCSYANEQECGLVGAGTGSFIRHVNAGGMPGILPGHRTTVDLGEGRPEFAIPVRALEASGGSDADLLYQRVLWIEPVRLPRALASYFATQERLRIPVKADFQPGGAELTEQSRKVLQPLVARLRVVPYYVRIEVHVGQGFLFNERYGNAWELTAARAAAIAVYFNTTGGMSLRRIEPIGYGSAQPLVRNPIDPRTNDRVEIVILKH